MPTIRKVPAAEAAAWPEQSEPIDIPTLLAALAGDDRTGLTRMDYPAKRMRGWMARVYAGGATSTRFWADERHGGAASALRTAIDWRDAMRRELTQLPRATGRTWRIVRVDRPEYKNVGFFAYADTRRYFSDSAYGGPDKSRSAAEAWLEKRRSAAE
jgi:hypothetical protein